MTAKERLAAAAAAAATVPGTVAPVLNLAEVEIQDGYEYDGKEIPDKFVIETADALFSIATSRCDESPERMLEMIQSGLFQQSFDKETGDAITTGNGKAVYSVPFKKDRTKTGVKLNANSVTVSDNSPASDPYANIVISVTKKSYK